MNTTRAQTVNNEVLSTPTILNADFNKLQRVQLRLQKPSRKKTDSESEDGDYLDLNSFATKKAASAGYWLWFLAESEYICNAGALGTSLLSSNADQLKTVLLKEQKNYFDFTKISLLGVSILLQVTIVQYFPKNLQHKLLRLLWCPWWSTWDLMGRLTVRRKNNGRIRSIMWAWSSVSWWL